MAIFNSSGQTSRLHISRVDYYLLLDDEVSESYFHTAPFIEEKKIWAQFSSC